MSTQEDINSMIKDMRGRLGMDKQPTPEGLIIRSKEELDRYIDARVAERVGFELDEYARKCREEKALRPSPREDEAGR